MEKGLNIRIEITIKFFDIVTSFEALASECVEGTYTYGNLIALCSLNRADVV